MVQTALKGDARYTYADYLRWDDGERWELIDGVAYNMPPAPTRGHQKISGELFRQIANHLHGRKCEVYDAPFDVRLPAPGETDDATSTVVQPDLVVVCDPVKLDDRGCKGAPDLVIEILSPDSASRDLKDKLLLVFGRGRDGSFGRGAVYTPEDHLRAGVLPDLQIDLALVFGVPPGSPESGRTS